VADPGRTRLHAGTQAVPRLSPAKLVRSASVQRRGVFAGSTSTPQPHFVGFGKNDGELTVTSAYGNWIRLVPTVGDPLVLTVRDLGLASDPNRRTTEEIAASPDVVPAGATYADGDARRRIRRLRSAA
jgi:hypothetical protein